MEQLHDKLKAWITNPHREHSEGVSLLTHVTRNKRLIKSLSQSESRYKQEKLLYEMKKHYKPFSSITTPVNISDTDRSQSAQNDIDALQPAVGPAAADAGLPITLTATKSVSSSSLLIKVIGGEFSDKSQIFEVFADSEHVAKAIAISEFIRTFDDYVDECHVTELSPVSPPVIEPLNTLPNIKGEKLPVITPTSPASPQDSIVAEHLQIGYSKMFNKKGMLINQLRSFAENDNEGRKNLMDQINDLKKDMEAVEAKIKHFQAHGVLPPQDPEPPEADTAPETVIPDDAILMNRMLLNERSNISKIKKKIKDGVVSPEKLGSLEEILAKKTEVVNEIERRLNGNGS